MAKAHQYQAIVIIMVTPGTDAETGFDVAKTFFASATPLPVTRCSALPKEPELGPVLAFSHR